MDGPTDHHFIHCRLAMHLASGGLMQHALENHNLTLTTDVNNTKILFNEFNHNKLSIMELIRKLQPSINTQSIGINRTLKNFHIACPYSNCTSLPPFFTYIVPTTCYTSTAITLSRLITMLTVPTKFVPFLYLGSLHNCSSFTCCPLMR